MHQHTPAKAEEKKMATKATTCANCAAPLGALFYLCRDCFFRLPGNERSELYTQHKRGLDVTAKVARCVRILKERATSV